MVALESCRRGVSVYASLGVGILPFVEKSLLLNRPKGVRVRYIAYYTVGLCRSLNSLDYEYRIWHFHNHPLRAPRHCQTRRWYRDCYIEQLVQSLTRVL